MKHYSEFGYMIDRSVWLTPSEFASKTGCGKQTLYNKKSSGELEQVLPEDALLTDGHFWWIRSDVELPFNPRKDVKAHGTV